MKTIIILILLSVVTAPAQQAVPEGSIVGVIPANFYSSMGFGADHDNLELMVYGIPSGVSIVRVTVRYRIAGVEFETKETIDVDKYGIAFRLVPLPPNCAADITYRNIEKFARIQ